MASMLAAPPVRSQNFAGIEANALPMAATNGRFASLQPAVSITRATVHTRGRLSYLDRPLEGTQPSPSADGTNSSVVEGSLLGQFAIGVGLGRGIDMGVALPLYFYQWGLGLSGPGAGQSIDGFYPGDPRLSLGWSTNLGAWSLRPYGTLFLPLGNSDAFAGENSARGDLGISSCWAKGRVALGLDLGVRIREESDIGLTRWGPQLRMGLGGAFQLTEHLDSSLELQLMPTLTSQPEPLLGEAGYLFPAEALASLAYDMGTLTLRLLGGTGLPFSRPSTDSPDRGLSRGPTSPRLRIGVDVVATF